MRLNRFLAAGTLLSRRKADQVIADGRVQVNGKAAFLGTEVNHNDAVTLDGQSISLDVSKVTIMLNKPAGYVVSRNGQGSKTIYDLLPAEYQHLQPIGRLDKDSSGLLLLTNDGDLSHELTHPSHQKEKVYEITLDKPLAANDRHKIEQGVQLEDGLSRLKIRDMNVQILNSYEIHMHEGRNRQIRRTFAVLGYKVTLLHRISFGDYRLGSLAAGQIRGL